jgi:hypothetical protein
MNGVIPCNSASRRTPRRKQLKACLTTPKRLSAFIASCSFKLSSGDWFPFRNVVTCDAFPL